MRDVPCHAQVPAAATYFDMRHTCVSTGNSGRLSVNMRTQATVFGPTPLQQHVQQFT